MFSPFTSSDSGDGGKAAQSGPEKDEAKTPSAKPSEDEIATLKEELSAMQQRLEQLSRR
jgi:polyhydroxyalkanoate synthesis regulator protein